MTIMMTEDQTKLTKRDLRGFRTEAVELILHAQEQGGRVKVSKRGHAIIAYRGKTCSIARNLKLQTRTAQNARAAVKRLFREEVTT